MHTNAYKGGGGGLNMTKNTHFVRRFIENATISETFKPLIMITITALHIERSVPYLPTCSPTFCYIIIIMI